MPKNFSKNAIDVDVSISSSMKQRMGVACVLLLVLMICLITGLIWWQWTALLLSCVLILRQTAHVRTPTHLAAKQVDGLWLLTMPKSADHAVFKYQNPPPIPKHNLPSWQIRRTNGSRLKQPKRLANRQTSARTSIDSQSYLATAITHQGYLTSAKILQLGVARVVILRFYMQIPAEKQITLVVFDDQVNSEDFRKLVTLSNVGIKA